MKKVFAIALAIIMTLSVVLGCSGKKETPPAKSTAVTQQQQKENGKAGSSAEKNKQNKQEKKAYNQVRQVLLRKRINKTNRKRKHIIKTQTTGRLRLRVTQRPGSA